MKLTELHFELPESQIAQEPSQRRDHSRMLVLDRATGEFQDRHFYDIPEYLKAGDVVVVNNTRVFPARLLGTREGFTGVIEAFLVSELAPRRWVALVKPGKRIRVGERLVFGEGKLLATVTDRTEDGRRILDFECEGEFFDVLDEIGRTPLPPYIRRDDASTLRLDRETYQTVYAKDRGSIAAPTAGLHYTPEVLEKLRGKGVEIHELTLHVGYGTFQPVRVDDLSQHTVEAESYAVPPATAAAVTAAKREGRRVIAVGTTSTRTLETVGRGAGADFELLAASGATELVITPGYEFKVLDGLQTNFHLPESSLLALVTAFGGYEPVMRAYRHAVTAGYRFYSYGDCMLIL
jgi:S-adenosylmethionine:tRNA ribosyltransferase-isomerase